MVALQDKESDGKSGDKVGDCILVMVSDQWEAKLSMTGKCKTSAYIQAAQSRENIRETDRRSLQGMER